MYLCVLSILQEKTFSVWGSQMHLTMYFSFTELSNQGLLGNLFGHISRQRDESQGGVWEVEIVLPPETWENWEQGQPWGKQGAGNFVLEKDLE